ncbi:hypothetical protein FI667_g15344, partial [Globisporangium splendens]
MNSDATTQVWLKGELTSALGFSEVDDITAYIFSAFATKQDAVPYLTELLGLPPSRAEAIATRLFTKPNAAAKPKKQQPSAPSALVPPAAVPNSRIKQPKSKKHNAPKIMHSRIINCLQCGKIEHNGGRTCAFCGTELRYEELDEHEIDRAAQQHMETLVLYDETSAARTTVIDTEQQFYEEVEARGDMDSRRPITLDLDLESKQFVLSSSSDVRGAPPNSARIRRNDDLSKDARDLCEGIQRRLDGDKKSHGRQQRQDGSAALESPRDAAAFHEEPGVVVIEEEFGLVSALLTNWSGESERDMSTASQESMMSPTAEESGKAPLNADSSVANASHSRSVASVADPLYAFYASGLDGTSGDEEDTEDELETQDWIRFQRARAQSRLNESCQREQHLHHAAKLRARDNGEHQ